MNIIFQEIEYSHLLYNTFGPLNLTLRNNGFYKFQTNNGSGKSILLKTILGILIPKYGNIITHNEMSSSREDIYGYSILSNSQTKKLLLLQAIFTYKSVYIMDEPYAFLDMTSISFLKKKINTLINKNITCVITDCIDYMIIPAIIYYKDIRWI